MVARYLAASLRGCITGCSTQAGFDWLFGLLFFAFQKCVHFRGVVGTVFERVPLIQRSVSSLGAHLKNLPALLDSFNIRLAESLLENSHHLGSWVRFPDQTSHRIRSKKATRSGANQPPFRANPATRLLWG